MADEPNRTVLSYRNQAIANLQLAEGRPPELAQVHIVASITFALLDIADHFDQLAFRLFEINDQLAKLTELLEAKE